MPGSIRSSTTRSGRLAAARVQRRRAVGRAVHGEAGPVEIAGDDLGDGRVVVHHEDPPGRSASARTVRARMRCSCCRV